MNEGRTNRPISQTNRRSTSLPSGRVVTRKKLYEWGDKPEEAYIAESREMKAELAQLVPEEQRPDILATLQHFLSDVSVAWEKASPEQRNRLARRLFEAVWVKDEHVVAVRPQPELRPFFQISEESKSKSLSGDSDRSRSIKTDFLVKVRPLAQERTNGSNKRYLYQTRYRLSEKQSRNLVRAARRGRSLRALAGEYGVSYETIRQALQSKK